MSKKITIHCDGGSRGNPGPAASAFVVYDTNGELIHELGKYLGVTTNNIAEYTAVLLAVKWLKTAGLGIDEIEFVLDSELVVRQLTGVYKIKNENLRSLALEIAVLTKKLDYKISYRNVLREKNKEADLLVNKTLDENQ